MTRKAKNKEIVQTDLLQAVTYARVSSKEQEKEGFSIPAQQKQLQGYAEAKGFRIAQEYVDVETAKLAGRINFSEMIQYLKKHPQVRLILVEKTDRLYRNLKDWVTLDELDIEIHLVKEGIILSRDSKSSEKFVHGIKVLMAKNYIDNLSEEARKGQMEKAEQGFWPSKAPLGYRNVTGPDGKKIIEPDSQIAGAITHLFGRYATGTMSLREVAEQAKAIGQVYRRTGGPPRSATFTPFCEIVSTQAISNGMDAGTRVGISHWSARSFGSACKVFLAGGTHANFAVPRMTSHSRA
jgi:site-specific DNA recombinase